MEFLHSAFGVGQQAQDLTIFQVLLRAVLIFFAALGIVRIADKRFFAKKTAFDVVLGLILASMLARAINGSEQLGPTIAAGFALALLHRLLGYISCAYPTFGGLIKGHSQTLITEGHTDRTLAHQHHISDDDLAEELRLEGVDSAEKVKVATLERSGEISVVKR
jgi:uncharacterized membrane protein YcaP (DUF421 family)